MRIFSARDGELFFQGLIQYLPEMSKKKHSPKEGWNFDTEAIRLQNIISYHPKDGATIFPYPFLLCKYKCAS